MRSTGFGEPSIMFTTFVCDAFRLYPINSYAVRTVGQFASVFLLAPERCDRIVEVRTGRALCKDEFWKHISNKRDWNRSGPTFLYASLQLPPQLTSELVRCRPAS